MDCSLPGSFVSMGFFRHKYWSEFPFPSLGELPDPGIKPTSPVSPALQADYLPMEMMKSRRKKKKKGTRKALYSQIAL